MTLVGTRTFIRERMTLLGFTEWEDAFDIDNVPESLLDKSYHIGSPGGDHVKLNMHDQLINAKVALVFWRMGFNTPAAAVDSSLVDIETILCDFLAPAQRVVPVFRNVVLVDYKLEPLSDDNNNIIRSTINLTVQVSLAVSPQI